MYGETVDSVIDARLKKGLSPHVRGNQVGRQARLINAGSIPACTGKPGEEVGAVQFCRVYPRMYGETSSMSDRLIVTSGLSPHVRGNRPLQMAARRSLGSIPACTGKPKSRGSFSSSVRVYPRMYGETVAQQVLLGTLEGLSPHVRGNLAADPRDGLRKGSIPACTGKPDLEPDYEELPEVYPRMYGETGEPALYCCLG